jgi:hypothetical protein
VMMYVIYLLCHTIRTDYGDECELPPTTRTPPIFGGPFLLVRTDRTAFYSGILHSYCIKKRTLKTKRNLKTDSNSKSYLKNLINFKPSWLLHPVSRF